MFCRWDSAQHRIGNTESLAIPAAQHIHSIGSIIAAKSYIDQVKCQENFCMYGDGTLLLLSAHFYVPLDDFEQSQLDYIVKKAEVLRFLHSWVRHF